MTTAQRIWYWFSPETREDIEALDKKVNGLTGGDPDETISERLAHARDRGDLSGRVGCLILDTIDPNHCQRARDYPTRRSSSDAISPR